MSAWTCLWMCMYVYVYTFSVCFRMGIHVYIRVCILMYISVCVHMSIHMSVFTCADLCKYPCSFICVRVAVSMMSTGRCMLYLSVHAWIFSLNIYHCPLIVSCIWMHISVRKIIEDAPSAAWLLSPNVTNQLRSHMCKDGASETWFEAIQKMIAEDELQQIECIMLLELTMRPIIRIMTRLRMRKVTTVLINLYFIHCTDTSYIHCNLANCLIL
jgi:hypothetical protein